MDVDVKNLRIVSGSADNKICVSLISSQVSVLNARRWVGHSTKFYTSTLLDSLSVELGFQSLAGFRIPKSRIPISTGQNFPDSASKIFRISESSLPYIGCDLSRMQLPYFQT